MITKALWLKTYAAEMNSDHKRHPDNWPKYEADSQRQEWFEILASRMTKRTIEDYKGVNISSNMKRACKKLGGSPTIKGVVAMLNSLDA